MLISDDRTRVRRTLDVHHLSWTTEVLQGDYAPLQSADQLAVLAARVGQLRWSWLLVQSNDESHRFAQIVVDARGQRRVEVGAVIGTDARHTVWRLEPAGAARDPGDFFAEIARDWFALGVLPGWTATRVDLLGLDDEPF